MLSSVFRLTDKIIDKLFNLLFLITPILIIPYTSELFEFNKMIFVYVSTILIVSFWIIKSIVSKKLFLRRTIFDIPLLIFLTSQAVSTIFSIDHTISLFGYYSRFNGSFLSSVSYALLFWAYVSNQTNKDTQKNLSLLIVSGVIVSIYGVLQRLGIDKNLWQQDVQNRVFSTLGQPNWLAAFLLPLMFVSWSRIIKNINQNKSLIVYFVISNLFFTVLIFTKSRSGFIALFLASIFHWILIWQTWQKKFSKITRPILMINGSIIFLLILFGSPWTPSAKQYITQRSNPTQITARKNVPAVEAGGTESGEIRKIVWKGAVDVWKHYPLIGSGVESFAYIFYRYRPVELNTTSEWNFLYNKAHNEYLNYLATTGLLGTLSVLLFIGTYYLSGLKIIFQKKSATATALTAGFTSIIITNFFGFSVVAVSFMFFLIPAMLIVINSPKSPKKYEIRLHPAAQKISASAVVLVSIIGFSFLIRWWYADLLYTQGKSFNQNGQYEAARLKLFKATQIFPNQPTHLSELAKSGSDVALTLNEQGKTDTAHQFGEAAITEIDQAIAISPGNVNLYRTKATILIQLAVFEPERLFGVEEVLEKAIVLAPTEPNLIYNLGLTQARIKKNKEAVSSFEKAVALKSDYRDARFALGIVLPEQGRIEEAKMHLNFILENINPDDELVKQQLAALE